MTYLKTFKREFLSILSNRGMLIILFIGPIFLLLFFGMVYMNDYVEDIPVAILDEDGSSLSRTLGEYFADNERFDVVAFPESRQELNDLIETGRVHMGLWIPLDFEKDVSTYQASQILVIMDGSNLVVANNAYAEATSIIKTVSAGIEMKLIEGKGVSPAIAENMALIFNVGERILYDSKMTYMNYLILSFLAVFLQQLFLAAMGSILLRHKDFLAQGSLLQNAWATASAVIVSLIPATGICLYILMHIYHVPFNGDMRIVGLMSVFFLMALTGPALILASLTKDRVTYAQFSLMISLPTFVLSGCVWPIELMPDALETGVRLAWPLINYGKIIQEIIIKNRSFVSVTDNIWQLAVYGLFSIIVGTRMYGRAFGEKPLELARVK